MDWGARTEAEGPGAGCHSARVRGDKGLDQAADLGAGVLIIAQPQADGFPGSGSCLGLALIMAAGMRRVERGVSFSDSSCDVLRLRQTRVHTQTPVLLAALARLPHFHRPQYPIYKTGTVSPPCGEGGI